jgi:N-acetylglucosaminyldiphosphoundecaprenol N-acetyl-beta-D-mannosaminyltransferase
VVIGEGGSFDYNQLGGGIKRAPKWMRKSGLEWLWRLLIQPSRFRRQLAIPLFIKKVRRAKIAQK